MEPLIANDWLKDYDPLFDLFDEEMRCSNSSQSGLGADYFNEYDLNNNYYNPCYKQTDELSLILGLEWMPCLDLNSPSTSSSLNSTSSTASTSQLNNNDFQSNSQSSHTFEEKASPIPTSPALITTTTPLITKISSKSSTIQAVNNNQQKSQNPNTTQTIKSISTTTTTNCNSIKNDDNNNVNTTGPQEQRVFRIQLQNNVNSNNKLGSTNSINQSMFVNANEFAVQQPASNGALKQKSCLVVNSNNNLIASSLIESTQVVSCGGNNSKKKKKCLKIKGTSLLAHPSCKLANNSTCSSNVSKSANKSTMPTLITINRPSALMTPLQQQQQQVLPKTTALLSTTTTLTNNQNNQMTPLTYIANGSAIINNTTNNFNLTKFNRTMRYCVKIEHAYSLKC